MEKGHTFVHPPSLSHTVWTDARSDAHVLRAARRAPGVLGVGGARRGVGGGGLKVGVRGAPAAIWQRHRHLHNVRFYLISHSKCNQKLMRALSCLADWQHDSAVTPNTAAPRPSDAI